MSETIGTQLYRARRLRGMTQEELGRSVNMYPHAIDHIEKGEYIISLDQCDKLAAALGTVNKYFCGKE